MAWTALTIIVLGLLFLLPIWGFGLWRGRDSQTTEAEDLVKKTRSIIDFSYAGPISRNLGVRLLLRAEPNRRLVSAYGICNSFTTSDVLVHHRFSHAASKGLNPSNATWQTLYNDATCLLENEVQQVLTARGRDRLPLPLASLVQGVSLRTILAAFFDADPFAPSREDIACVAEEINRQWVLSKNDPDGVKKSELLNTAVMNLHLKSLLHDGQQVESAEEALSFIMPAYETLWRVVLLTFVNAYHRVCDPGATVRLVKDVPACLGIPGEEDEALKLAKEGLRLYPSTKRIRRSLKLSSSSSSSSLSLSAPVTVTVSADVERCHMHPAIWGPDFAAFRPGRFDESLGLTAAQKCAYFPFGLPPHRCPAHSGFGNRMVTLLVVALGRVFSPARASVNFNDAELDVLRDTPLPTGREDMEAWEVVMV